MRAYFNWLPGLLLLLTANAHADWPDFRGPWADGRAAAAGDNRLIGLPVHWSETEDVKWKTPIPFKGWSSPVIWGRQIWLTTATMDGHDFYALCVDAVTGKMLYNEKLFHADTPEPLGNDLNCYASPSPVIEAGRVYVHFGSYGTACLDTGNFKVIWQRTDLPCRHFRGPGSSPFIFNDLLVLTMDGIDQEYLTALDKHTGKTIWRTDRTSEWNDAGPDGKPMGGGDFRKGFTTPIVFDVDGKKQMLSVAGKSACAYDPLTGKELWKVHYSTHTPAARPLFDHGIAYISDGNGKAEMLAVKVDAQSQGDVTDSHIVWRSNRGVPRMPSPVLADGLLFLLNDGGIATCLEEATGTEVWHERVSGEYSSSLLYGDGNLYAFSRDGVATVLKAGRTFETLATNRLADGFMASPAVDGKALILRTKSALYRIEDGVK